MSYPPVSTVSTQARRPYRDGHLDLYTLADGSRIGYLTITDPLVGPLVAWPVTGVALADLIDRIETAQA